MTMMMMMLLLLLRCGPKRHLRQSYFVVDVFSGFRMKRVHCAGKEEEEKEHQNPIFDRFSSFQDISRFERERFREIFLYIEQQHE